MEIHGDETFLTPSEAHWALYMFFSRAPGLAQKILDAHVAYAGDGTVSRGPEPLTIPQGQLESTDLMASAEVQDAADMLYEQTRAQASTPDGTEQNVIKVSLSRPEKRNLLKEAERDYRAASQHVEHPEQVCDEDEFWQRNMTSQDYGLISDFGMTPSEEAVRILHSADFRERQDREDAARFKRHYAILPSLISVLQTDLNPPA